MARTTSPFAALTSEQKQMKWMEYQSIRLPYTEAELTVPQENSTAKQPVPTVQTIACPEERAPAVKPQAAAAVRPAPSDRPQPPPEVYMNPVPHTGSGMQSTQEKTRHHQYDAVIARMKQAELRTGSYCSWSK